MLLINVRARLAHI